MLWEGGPLRVAVDAEPSQRGESLLNVYFPEDRTLHDVADDLIRTLLIEALKRSKGSKKGAAKLLGISRNSLYRYMKRLRIMGDSGTPG
jgi:transcriptional regulator of acetoin/glycerol metabolism